MKKTLSLTLAFALLLVVCALVCSGCGGVADKNYQYEKDGFGGTFTIRIETDGTMQYYEGMLSSHAGVGTWTLEDDILTISEDNGKGGQRVNRFRVEGDDLCFIAEGSDNFIHIQVADGDRFHSKKHAS